MSPRYLAGSRLPKAADRSRGLQAMLTVALAVGCFGLLTGCSQPTVQPAQPTQAYNPHHPQCVQGLQVDNLVYAVKGRDTLTVDIYTDPAATDGQARPLLIYLYGGGFESGTRWDTSSDLVNFLPYMVQEYGYVGAAIDYRMEFANARREGRVPADLLARMGVPYCMYTVVGGNHVINGSPTVTSREDIHAFIRRNVDMKTPWTMEITERSLTVPHDYDWMAQEYILPLLEQHPEYAAQLASGEGDDTHRPGQSGR